MTPSLNALAAPLAASLRADADLLRLKVSGDGPIVVDAGIDCLGGIEAGRRIMNALKFSPAPSAASPRSAWADSAACA